MIFSSPILAEASGSVGGLVFSHGRGGPYVRARATVTNPNSPEQQLVRSLLSQLTSLWLTTLSAAQRNAWADYADNVPLPNRLGVPRNVTALNMYVRSNIPLIQAGFARQDVAPTVFNLGDFTAPTGTVSVATQLLTISFADTDDWVTEDDAAMLVYAGRQQAASILFFKGPYRFAGSIDGDLALPLTSPQDIGLPFVASLGNNIHYRVQVVRADGRLSSDAALVAFVNV